MHLTQNEIHTLLAALNDREGVLSADFEAARRAHEGGAAEQQARKSLSEVRELGYRLARELRKAA